MKLLIIETKKFELKFYLKKKKKTEEILLCRNGFNICNNIVSFMSY